LAGGFSMCAPSALCMRPRNAPKRHVMQQTHDSI
jgi:hypothetical protein